MITTPLTFVSTNAVILYEKLRPVFADVDPDYLSLSPKSVLAKAIQYRYNSMAAVLWVHYGGAVHPEFLKTAEKLKSWGIRVIEDCAHAAGSFYSDGSRVGSKNISCFSYHAVKNMPSFDGGAITLYNEKDYKRAKKLAWMGIDKDTYERTNSAINEIYKWKYDVPELGWKYNGNEISAIMALVALKYLDKDNAYRRQIYQWYKKHDLDLALHSSNSAHHLAVAKVNNRDQVISTLKANNIAPGVHYTPNFEFEPFKKYYGGGCKNVENLADKIISLPNHLNLTKSDVDKVATIIKEIK